MRQVIDCNTFAYIFIFTFFFLFYIGTKFGHMLDMLTDRAANMGLLFMLGAIYPSYLFWFQMSSCLDVVGHWFYVHR